MSIEIPCFSENILIHFCLSRYCRLSARISAAPRKKPSKIVSVNVIELVPSVFEPALYRDVAHRRLMWHSRPRLCSGFFNYPITKLLNYQFLEMPLPAALHALVARRPQNVPMRIAHRRLGHHQVVGELPAPPAPP